MRLVISHPTANQNVRAAVHGFIEAGITTCFRTTIATFPGGVMDALSTFKALRSLERRRFDSSFRSVTRVWPWLEVGRLMASRIGMRLLTKHESGLLSVDAVYRNLDRHVAATLENGNVDAIYAYEDGALASFRKARSLSIPCHYDLPIGYWRVAHRIFEEQKEAWPEWSDTLPGLKNSEEKLLRKDEELYLADRVYVASTFTAATLKEFSGTLPNISVVPYGFPPVAMDREYRRSKGDPLKVLFVGGLTQRKGIANLFAAVDDFRNFVQLTVVGQKTNASCTALDRALMRHRWIPSLPHRDVLAEMRGHDVLIFPSLFEGFGLVITEAMSQGTPVITTDRTAGPDVIDHGVDGWVIRAGSANEIRRMLDYILSHRSMLEDVGRAAMQRAQKRPWEVYGMELARAVMASHDTLS